MGEKTTGIVNVGGTVKIDNCAIGKNASVTVNGQKKDDKDQKKK
jgi:hypothetical protein